MPTTNINKFLFIMRKPILIICFLLAGIAAQAGEPLQGLWTVTQVAVEKNTGGDIQNTVYNAAAEVQSFIPCIQEMKINEQTITVRYPSGREETAAYTIKDDLLIIYISVGAQTYRYSISGENLILIADYRYVNNNLQEKTTTRITEQRTITLSMQQAE